MIYTSSEVALKSEVRAVDGIVQQTAPFQTINIKIYPVIFWELIKRVNF